MEILKVENLQKKYEKFTLKNVSFTLEKGYIMGFIGRNGAGKTTTLKTLLGMVHADGGSVTMFGKDFRKEELACKQELGIVFGGVDFFQKKTLRTITSVTKRLYDQWDEKIYMDCLKKFSLDEDKRIDQLSDGMRVKYSLALAMSHNAKLLILDEPTSGLDPVSRDELVELFQTFIEDGERSILFSTHITSDLEKCADYITYIRDGQLVDSTTKDEFIDKHRMVKGTKEQMTDEIKSLLIGYKKNSFGFCGLLLAEHISEMEEIEKQRSGDGTCTLEFMPADLEDIMVYHEKQED